MRLVNFGAGEIADRLSILALKILFGTAAGKDVKHFRDEQTALLKTLNARTLGGESLRAVFELAGINGALWHAEDDLRAYRLGVAEPTEVMVLAFRIQGLNDQRAGAIERINKDSGTHLGEEKVT